MPRLEDSRASEDASKESATERHAPPEASPPERLVPDGPRARGAWVLLALFVGLCLVGFALHHLIAAQRP